MTDPSRSTAPPPALEDALREYFAITSGADKAHARALAALAGGELSDAEADAALGALDEEERAAWDADLTALEAIWADAEAGETPSGEDRVASGSTGAWAGEAPARQGRSAPGTADAEAGEAPARQGRSAPGAADAEAGEAPAGQGRVAPGAADAEAGETRLSQKPVNGADVTRPRSGRPQTSWPADVPSAASFVQRDSLGTPEGQSSVAPGTADAEAGETPAGRGSVAPGSTGGGAGEAPAGQGRVAPGAADAEAGEAPAGRGRDAVTSLEDARNARRRRLLGLVTTLALAAVAVFVIAQPPADEGVRFKGGPTAGVADWSLQIGVKRGDERFVLGSGGTLKTDDQLGFFYSAAAAGHLMVAYVDAGGAVVRLFPRDADRARSVPAGREMRLDAGATLTGGEGCEWVVGALGDAPFDLEALADDVRAARDAGAPCALRLPDHGARSYRAVLIRR